MFKEKWIIKKNVQFAKKTWSFKNLHILIFLNTLLFSLRKNEFFSVSQPGSLLYYKPNLRQYLCPKMNFQALTEKRYGINPLILAPFYFRDMVQLWTWFVRATTRILQRKKKTRKFVVRGIFFVLCAVFIHWSIDINLSS